MVAGRVRPLQAAFFLGVVFFFEDVVLRVVFFLAVVFLRVVFPAVVFFFAPALVLGLTPMASRASLAVFSTAGYRSLIWP